MNGQSDTISDVSIMHLRRLIGDRPRPDQLIKVLHAQSGDEVDQKLSRITAGIAQVSRSISPVYGVAN